MGVELKQVSRFGRRVAFAAVALATTVALSGCSSQLDAQLKRIGLVPPASDRAPYMEKLWQGAWVAALILGVLVWGLIGFAALRWRRRAGDPELPKQTRYHLPLELLYTLIPVLIIGVLFFYTVRTQDKVLVKDAKPQHTISVVAQKWSWSFNYMEADNPQVGTVVHTVGSLAEYPDLYLPVNQSVRFDLTAVDVNHSFWVPAFYFKMDAIPGHPNSFDLTPTKVGTFDGKCAELCGTYHSKMLFTVHVVSEADYIKHLQQLKAQGDVGAYTGPVGASVLPTPQAQGSAEEGEGK